jgi:hypothetical protein
LVFNAPSGLPAAAAVEPAQEPPPPPSRDDSSVSASPSPPDSPKIICSQYRQAQHDEATAASPAREEPPTFITVQENVSDRRRRMELGQDALFKRDPRDWQLYVRADHRNPEGQAPLCYVATGYKGDPAPDSEPHQGYMVYNEPDLRWARRLKFHLRRLQA